MSHSKAVSLEQSLREQRQSQFFNLSRDLLCIAGFDGYFKHLNRAWEQSTGFSSSELLAHPYLSFIHIDDLSSTAEVFTDLTRGASLLNLQSRFRCKDGSFRWLLWNAVAVDKERLLYATARDITEQRDADRRLTAEHAVTQVLADSISFAKATPQILKIICEVMGWEFGAMWEADLSVNLLRCIDMWHSARSPLNEFITLTAAMTFAMGVGLPGRVWDTGRAAWISDVMLDGNFPRLAAARTCGLHAAFAFPIVVGAEVNGVMEFFSQEPRPPDDHLLHMMSALGTQIGLYTARKQAERQREQLILELQASMANIKTLRGFLPICATCSKIRDEAGAWHRIEDYVSARSDASFTHGICGDCARQAHPDWDVNK
jgi:PAS domain S-box-containing protein